ncbi:LacI family transcriptional regulator [Microbacterium protaetiae]|uniref:LacI family transcriptional regulator n=1 Tax=Microbacterium protaetiae TaxID=2509458 RepID=A0A4P6EAH5_9MICO|nr:LacI family DNA-binding transcriptional regulator [Microbacterium protaetiae]QAY59085.1 LacI family transcriptional regulator [Microbacterium protaetiae]
MPARRRATMQDVAHKAGVSKSAVSLAYNDSKKLSDATLQRILRVADELGFSQDPAARMLRTRRTDSLGLLLPQQLDKVLENPYYSLFLQGIGQTCYQEGFTLLLAPPLRGSMLKTIPYAAVDGFIVSGLEYDRGEVTALRQRGIPFVLVDSEWHEGVPSVDIDESEGIAELVEHLLRQGHRRIAIVAFETGVDGGYRNWKGPVLRRMQGATRALAAAGLAPDSDGITILEVPCTRPGGADAFKTLWGLPERPTAIVAFSDIIAYGVLDAAREAGLVVPDDLSVSGFDDLTESSWTTPTLTTIRQPIATKGRLAAEYLIEAIAGSGAGHPHQQRLSTALLIRHSTGPAPTPGPRS